MVMQIEKGQKNVSVNEPESSDREYLNYDLQNQVKSLVLKVESAQKIIKIEGGCKSNLETTLIRISNLDVLSEKIAKILQSIIK